MGWGKLTQVYDTFDFAQYFHFIITLIKMGPLLFLFNYAFIFQTAVSEVQLSVLAISMILYYCNFKPKSAQIPAEPTS